MFKFMKPTYEYKITPVPTRPDRYDLAITGRGLTKLILQMTAYAIVHVGATLVVLEMLDDSSLARRVEENPDKFRTIDED